MRPIQTRLQLGENALVEQKSSLGYKGRSAFVSVLAIALLMSAFFWLGYWTAERNHDRHAPVVVAAPSQQPSEQAQKPDASRPENSGKTEQDPPNDNSIWVNL